MTMRSFLRILPVRAKFYERPTPFLSRRSFNVDGSRLFSESQIPLRFNILIEINTRLYFINIMGVLISLDVFGREEFLATKRHKTHKKERNT